jgi:hypothetical protein
MRGRERSDGRDEFDRSVALVVAADDLRAPFRPRGTTRSGRIALAQRPGVAGGRDATTGFPLATWRRMTAS